MKQYPQILIIDDNQLITKALQKALLQHFHLDKKNVRILPDNKNNSKDKIEDLLVRQAHKYAVLINANCSFTETSGRLSYGGILLLQRVYENASDYGINIRPLIISFQSLKHLKGVQDPLCKILLENEQLYCFKQLPVSVQSLNEYFNNWRA